MDIHDIERQARKEISVAARRQAVDVAKEKILRARARRAESRDAFFGGASTGFWAGAAVGLFMWPIVLVGYALLIRH